MVFKIHVISHLGSLFSILSFSFLLVSTKVDIWSVKFSLAHGKADYIIFIIQEFNFIPWTLSQTPNMGTCCVIKKVVRSKNQVLLRHLLRHWIWNFVLLPSSKFCDCKSEKTYYHSNLLPLTLPLWKTQDSVTHFTQVFCFYTSW